MVKFSQDANGNLDMDPNGSTLTVDQTNDRVGIGTMNPSQLLEVAGVSNFTGTINASAAGNSISVTDTLRIAETGSGLRMTNVGAFDNDGSTNFRVFATNDLILCANGDAGTAITIDATAQDVTIQNDLRIGASSLYIAGSQVTATASDINQLTGVTLGTAASSNTGDFATAAQGAKADTALQTVAVDGVTVTGDGTVGNPLVAVGGGGGTPGGNPGEIQFNSAGSFGGDSNLFWDDTNDRLGVGTNAPSHTLHVRNLTAVATVPLARFQSDEGNVLFNRYGGIMIQNNEPSGSEPVENNRWQMQQRDGDNTDPPDGPFDISYGDGSGGFVGASATIIRATSGGNVGIGLGNTNPSTRLHVNGTVRQTNSTSAVLVSDANGDIGSASNLQDLTYLQPGQAETDTFTPVASVPSWGPPGPPATIQDAIDRLASFVGSNLGPIP